jgi:NAD(P)H dehydrogenase (quinone)
LSIVVSATSGHLGRLIVEDLLDRGVPATDVVAGARSLDAIKGLTEAGVRTAVVDYDDSSTVEGALTGGDTFVLVSGNDLVPGQATFASLMVEARLMTLRSLGSVACRFRQAM